MTSWGSYGNAGLIILNSTLTGNTNANYGGAIANSGTGGTGLVMIANCTLSDNYCDSGEGDMIYNTGGNVYVGSSILKVFAAPLHDQMFNNGGSIVSQGFNIYSDSGVGLVHAAGDQINTDPMLGPLQDNGGPTFTHALLPGSPAIDKGKNFSASATDQRGRPRPYDNPGIPNAAGGDGSDIGAFEFIPPALAIARNFGNVVLSWPTNDPGYRAESTAFPLNSGNTWTTVPGTPLVIGNQYLLGDGPVTGHKFYRLNAP